MRVPASDTSKKWTLPAPRRGLRRRVITMFAVGGLLLTVLLAVITYGLADRYLTDQREGSATRQAYVNARAIRDDLNLPSSDVSTTLAALELPTTSSVVMHRAGNWFSTSVGVSRADVPVRLQRLVRSGVPGHQRVMVGNNPVLVVGLPIPSAGTEYFQIFSLSELESTLGVIRGSVIGAACAGTALAGLLGLWASRRVLKPLRDVGAAAEEIAEGDLGRRLDRPRDHDLATLTTSFNRMVEELETRIQRDARFASSVSHELRSPLTTLATASELLDKQRDDFPERMRPAVDALVSDVKRFQRLVQELLELSRAEADVDAATEEPVRLAELVRHHQSSSDGAGFAVQIAPDVSDVALLTDKRRLDRVVTNLVENARTHGGGVTALTVDRKGNRVQICVDDSGPGIPAAERQRIFERFYRGPASGRRGSGSGTGLGLALVAEHIRVLGGEVRVDEAPHGGARFVVELPWKPA